MSLRRYVMHIGLGLLYALVYIRCYVGFLNKHFEYAGFVLIPRDTMFLAVSFFIAVLPVVCYRGVRGVSSVIAVLIYFLLYVPIILTFALGSGQPLGEIVLVQVTFMFGMCLLFVADVVVIRNPLDLDSGIDLMPAVLVLTCLSIAHTLAAYRGNLSFASFEEVYVQRSASETLGAGLVARYVSSWLSTVLVPLCFAYGLVTRRLVYLTAAVAACVILYMAAANKIMILLPFVYLGFYLFTRKRLPAIYPILSSALSVVMVVLVAVAPLGRVALVTASIVLSRTIGTGGLLASTYYDFFSFHARTDYSHVNGIKLLTHPYPYGDLGLGQVVGQFYWSPLMNANASFWTTDGIAAMGLLGVAVISAACALLFVVMNSVTRAYDTLFVSLCFLPFVTILLNQSLFSSFWSGGALFLLLFFLFNKRSAILMNRVLAVPASGAGQ
jgi:hypothetical protein